MSQLFHPTNVMDHLRAALLDCPAGPLFVGYSGGLDSSVLSHALSRLVAPDRLQLLHVDHQLHADSAQWATRAQRFAHDLGLTLQHLQVSVDLDAGLGLEGAAREARYRAFRQAMPPASVLVLAHHRQDQAETLLLRLMRGSGSGALAGMRPLRALDNTRGQDQPTRWVWRPLLDFDRQDIAAYAAAEHIDWLEDPANARLDLDRNWIRHRVLPALTERWPQASRRLAAASERLRAEAIERERLAEQRLAAAATLDPTVRQWPCWRMLDRFALGEVLRAWCRQLGHAPPPASVIDRLHAQLPTAAGRGEREQFRLNWGTSELRSYRGLLRLARPLPPLRLTARRWNAATPLPLAGGGRLQVESATAIATDWQVSSRCGGERLRLPGRRHTSAVKKCLQELGVPPWEREQLPLLWQADGELLAAGDLLISAPLEAWLAEHQARLRWIPPDYTLLSE